jgi:hypothetical protein
MLTKKEALANAGTLGYPSKMPGTSYGLSAHACITGTKLASIPGSVCHGCYALGGNYFYPSVESAHATRLDAISNPLWTRAMISMLLATHKSGKGRHGPIKRGWHRWHDSGDLQSALHLEKICDVARGTPKIRHWLPTREFGIVSDYVANGGVIPANLLIRVSATMIDGPATKAWPFTSGVHDRKPAEGFNCPALRRKGDLHGKCGPCRKCWSPDVPHVSYPFHN